MMTQKNHRVVTIFLSFIFVVLFVFFLASITVFWGSSAEYAENNNLVVDSANKDEYDPAFARLNSVEKIVQYCDSVYDNGKSGKGYPEVISQTIRKKFYHGYSFYTWRTNPLAKLFHPLIDNGSTAIVVPDDITKHAMAACSQQSIVGMEVFKKKGYQVRKVSMFDEQVSKSGHFAFEVYYDNAWHFFDTDKEPSLRAVGINGVRPSIAYLKENPDAVLQAYRQTADPQLYQRLIMSASNGPVNTFPARNAYKYQQLTKFVSHFGWLFIGGLLLIRYFVVSRKRAWRLKSKIEEKKTYQLA